MSCYTKQAVAGLALLGASMTAWAQSHLLWPSQFANRATRDHQCLVVDRRALDAPLLLPVHRVYVSRTGLVDWGRQAQAIGKTLLVIDYGRRARADVAILRQAHITRFFVLRGGARRYRQIMRFGSY